MHKSKMTYMYMYIHACMHATVGVAGMDVSSIRDFKTQKGDTQIIVQVYRINAVNLQGF